MGHLLLRICAFMLPALVIAAPRPEVLDQWNPASLISNASSFSPVAYLPTTTYAWTSASQGYPTCRPKMISYLVKVEHESLSGSLERFSYLISTPGSRADAPYPVGSIGESVYLANASVSLFFVISGSLDEGNASLAQYCKQYPHHVPPRTDAEYFFIVLGVTAAVGISKTPPPNVGDAEFGINSAGHLTFRGKQKWALCPPTNCSDETMNLYWVGDNGCPEGCVTGVTLKLVPYGFASPVDYYYKNRNDYYEACEEFHYPSSVCPIIGTSPSSPYKSHAEVHNAASPTVAFTVVTHVVTHISSTFSIPSESQSLIAPPPSYTTLSYTLLLHSSPTPSNNGHGASATYESADTSPFAPRHPTASSTKYRSKPYASPQSHFESSKPHSSRGASSTSSKSISSGFTVLRSSIQGSGSASSMGHQISSKAHSSHSASSTGAVSVSSSSAASSLSIHTRRSPTSTLSTTHPKTSKSGFLHHMSSTRSSGFIISSSSPQRSLSLTLALSTNRFTKSKTRSLHRALSSAATSSSKGSTISSSSVHRNKMSKFTLSTKHFESIIRLSHSTSSTAVSTSSRSTVSRSSVHISKPQTVSLSTKRLTKSKTSSSHSKSSSTASSGSSGSTLSGSSVKSRKFSTFATSTTHFMKSKTRLSHHTSSSIVVSSSSGSHASPSSVQSSKFRTVTLSTKHLKKSKTGTSHHTSSSVVSSSSGFIVSGSSFHHSGFSTLSLSVKHLKSKIRLSNRTSSPATVTGLSGSIVSGSSAPSSKSLTFPMSTKHLKKSRTHSSRHASSTASTSGGSVASSSLVRSTRLPTSTLSVKRLKSSKTLSIKSSMIRSSHRTSALVSIRSSRTASGSMSLSSSPIKSSSTVLRRSSGMVASQSSIHRRLQTFSSSVGSTSPKTSSVIVGSSHLSMSSGMFASMSSRNTGGQLSRSGSSTRKKPFMVSASTAFITEQSSSPTTHSHRQQSFHSTPLTNTNVAIILSSTVRSENRGSPITTPHHRNRDEISHHRTKLILHAHSSPPKPITFLSEVPSSSTIYSSAISDISIMSPLIVFPSLTVSGEESSTYSSRALTNSILPPRLEESRTRRYYNRYDSSLSCLTPENCTLLSVTPSNTTSYSGGSSTSTSRSFEPSLASYPEYTSSEVFSTSSAFSWNESSTDGSSSAESTSTSEFEYIPITTSGLPSSISTGSVATLRSLFDADISNSTTSATPFTISYTTVVMGPNTSVIETPSIVTTYTTATY